MALFSPPPPTHLLRFLSSKPNITHKPTLFLGPKIPFILLSLPKSSTDNGAGISAAVEELKPEENVAQNSGSAAEAEETSLAPKVAVADADVKLDSKFVEPRWIGGTWDLKQFQKDGKTDWDAVIDAGEVLGFDYLSAPQLLSIIALLLNKKIILLIVFG